MTALTKVTVIPASAAAAFVGGDILSFSVISDFGFSGSADISRLL